MRFALTSSAPHAVRCDLAALPVAEPGSLDGLGVEFDRLSNGRLSAAAAEQHFSGKRGQTLLVQSPEAPARRILLVGTGGACDGEDLRRYAAIAVRHAHELRAGTVTLAVAAGPGTRRVPAGERVRAVVEGAVLGAYRFDRYRTAREDVHLKEIAIFGGDDSDGTMQAGLVAGEITAGAVSHARDLVNEPPNVLTPTALAAVAQHIAARDGLACRILDIGEARSLGMGLFAAVAAGSAEPARFIVVEYHPEARREPSRSVPLIALVGKGITFDSGGLSIKSADKLWRQKADMGGAAAIIAAVGALRALAVPVRVLAVVAAAENMISGSAVRPGDIVRGLGGKTVEILNTDAEGRLVLADALSYAIRTEPDVIVDMATLTAAAAAALGPRAGAVMGNDQDLIDRLLRAAEFAGEHLWQLPLYEEFLDDMRGELADLRNVSTAPDGGAEKAAAFLRHFVGETPWAHIDIGKAAFCVERGSAPSYLVPGGTGYGVRTLLRYLTAVDASPTQ
jgi:leucyl aminopeptidase